ncbi:MAG: twin-arginine translocase subunit TatC [Dongiaceae bacterium]
MTDDPEEAKKMPLLDHLVELRQRLVYSSIALVVAFAICWVFRDRIFNFLAQPLADILLKETGRRFIYTGLTEVFFTEVKIALFGAAVLAFPIFASQIWLFVAPGLYKHERSAFLPFLIASPILFLVGSAFLYYVMMPLAWRFFLGFQNPGGPETLPVQLEARVSEYIGLVMKLILAFGISFQLPVLLTLLVRAGLIGTESLVRKRRYAIVGVFIFAAIVTPPDPISQISLAIPLLLLYEASILAARLIERQRARREAQQEAATRDVLRS